MAIATIRSADSDSGPWHITEFEHEVVTPQGRLLDLKADYGFDELQVLRNCVYLFMSTSDGTSSIQMVWSELAVFEAVTIGKYLPAEDGRVGIIGVRLMPRRSGVLDFEIELDWIRVVIACDAFEIRTEGT